MESAIINNRAIARIENLLRVMSIKRQHGFTTALYISRQPSEMISDTRQGSASYSTRFYDLAVILCMQYDFNICPSRHTVANQQGCLLESSKQIGLYICIALLRRHTMPYMALGAKE
ncbi:hypothetical protein PILCRDRAFT_760715 [Piloderma croceum F 1598]|uniref:Uncharacterized protein n=1 Tax=Piloderma croceum (strain F 1598) TaxID=765440 RepID=A0A0C3AB39_PILCF|nr:hypothetical protein PILCRDRAFT_760715 [Piloderma croceum F 1598]